MSASLFFELVATVACGVIGIVAVGTIVQPDAARPPRVRRDRRDDLLP